MGMEQVWTGISVGCMLCHCIFKRGGYRVIKYESKRFKKTLVAYAMRTALHKADFTMVMVLAAHDISESTIDLFNFLFRS